MGNVEVEVSNVSNLSNHNRACSETQLIEKLCNCVSKGINWCFIHNTVEGAGRWDNGVNKQFGFMSLAHVPAPLFTPPVILSCYQKNLVQWACEAHLLPTG